MEDGWKEETRILNNIQNVYSTKEDILHYKFYHKFSTVYTLHFRQ